MVCQMALAFLRNGHPFDEICHHIFAHFDLTPLNFFLSDYVKDKIYTNAPPSIQVLKNNIRSVIREIEPEM